MLCGDVNPNTKAAVADEGIMVHSSELRGAVQIPKQY